MLLIIVEVFYDILVYIIDTETYTANLDLISSFGWNFYGFCSNYLWVRLAKIFAKKIVFHQTSVRQPKGIRLTSDNSNDGSMSKH